MVLNPPLNSKQLEAVNWGAGPALVLAGPGSGKTTILAHRMARIMRESAGKSFGILGLTFTDKAASEIKRRIWETVGDPEERINVTTFHSFSADLLRQHGHHTGIRPDFTILSQASERMSVLNEAIKMIDGRKSCERPGDEWLMSCVMRLTQKNATFDEAVALLGEGKDSELARRVAAIYANYRELMVTNSELDFDGLVAEALKLLRQTRIGGLVAQIYPHICVDEFQDTTPAQYEILSRIVGQSAANLFAVADNDQIIYGWNGADTKRLESIQNDFGAKVLYLPESYRCPPQVIDAANSLVENNPGRDHKASLISARSGPGRPIRCRMFETFKDEIIWVADQVAKQAGEPGTRAVIARKRKILDPIAEALEARGVSAQMPGKNDFATDKMRWAHFMLQLADARGDVARLRRACRSFYALTGTRLAVDGILSSPAAAGGDYLRGWLGAALQNAPDRETESFLSESVGILADHLDAWGFLEGCFAWFDKMESASGKSAYAEEKGEWDEFAASLDGRYGARGATLHELVGEIEMRNGEPGPPDSRVYCHTIHSSKDARFDHVYLVGLAEDELPDWRAVQEGEGGELMLEERRLCFVAITRTQERLSLTHSRSMFGQNKAPSRFLAEMGLE